MVVATQRVKLFILSTSLRMLTARCLYLGFCHAYNKFKRTMYIDYLIFIILTKPCNYHPPLLSHRHSYTRCHWGLSAGLLMLYHLFSFTYVVVFLPLYTCILCFNVVYTDKHSGIVIETSVDQIYVSWTMKQNLCWNTSTQLHRTVKASSTLCRISPG